MSRAIFVLQVVFSRKAFEISPPKKIIRTTTRAIEPPAGCKPLYKLHPAFWNAIRERITVATIIVKPDTL